MLPACLFASFQLKIPVKPPNRKSPRQSSTFAWRMSYGPNAIINKESKKAPATAGALVLSKEQTTANPLFGRIWA